MGGIEKSNINNKQRKTVLQSLLITVNYCKVFV